MLLMSKAELFSPKPADFLVTTEKKPRFDFRKAVDFAESKNAAPVVAANTLRAHQNIFISRKADVFDVLFVNGVEVCYEHDGSFSMDENEIALAD